MKATKLIMVLLFTLALVSCSDGGSAEITFCNFSTYEVYDIYTNFSNRNISILKIDLLKSGETSMVIAEWPEGKTNGLGFLYTINDKIFNYWSLPNKGIVDGDKITVRIYDDYAEY